MANKHLVADLDFMFNSDAERNLWEKTFKAHGINRKYKLGWTLIATSDEADLALADYVINYHHVGDDINWLDSWIPGIAKLADSCKGHWHNPSNKINTKNN